MDSKLYCRSFELWLQDTNIDLYSTCNEEKSIILRPFIKTLYKHVTSIWFLYLKMCTS